MFTRSPQSELIFDVILHMVNDEDYVSYYDSRILGRLSWYCLSSRSTFYWSTNSSRIIVFLDSFARLRAQFLMDQFKHPSLSSVIPMMAPTWCHRAIGGNPGVGEC